MQRKQTNMATNELASCNHVNLLPDKNKATFRNFFKNLCFNRHISETELLDHNCYEDEEIKILHRGMIYLSMFIQISLKHMSKPMKICRSFIEGFLNRGVTQRESDKYYSFLGHSDYRLDLSKDIKHGDARYYPALTVMASKLSYENKAVIRTAVTDHWKMEFVDFYNFYNEYQRKLTTQAFIFRERNADGDRIIVAFRGTSPFVADDWSTDFDFSWLKIGGMGKTHMGFMIALGLQKFSREDDDYYGDFSGSWPKEVDQHPQQPLAYYTIREKLKELLGDDKNAKIIVTGHSLGGALAILFPAVLAFHGEVELLNRLEGIYTYGQPRVGDREFGEFMKKNLREHKIKYYRIVYNYDLVTKVPLDDALMTFKHFGKCIVFNSLYHGKVVKEEEERSGNIILRILILIIVTLFNFIVARLTAVWELIRGFFIGLVKGPEYKEGWMLTFLRVTGIFLPSIVNHFPQDYVNSTRLASEDLFKVCPALL
ncbi:triacylglycerol lipase OBL1 [Beta vulgaris subsp. vulgaris]|uniref:triacylglycerol lipase OBL1 n=1 Tax=Beta vulgaris subsp. vulgaris TaxID=3555 RepID=UPI0020375B86|nr:triacylglycerol lipase OBL1 [Beta vulgaris subsp. vulgaris]